MYTYIHIYIHTHVILCYKIVAPVAQQGPPAQLRGLFSTVHHIIP